MDIKKIRKAENEAIKQHLSAIKEIIKEKCSRCDFPYGCLGCVFSEGEMMNDINHALNLIEKCGD